MNKFLILSVLILLLNCSGGDVKDIIDRLPEKILDWKTEGEVEQYDRTTLYDYMDGGAEIYLDFDFKNVTVRRYTDEEENEIVLDIYDMGSPEEAFGIFSIEREDEDIGIGQDSEYGPGLLRFWKDRFFVSIIAKGDENKAEQAMKEIGEKAAALIEREGTLPEMINCLPKKGLVKDKTSYCHSDFVLNNRFFVASENILNLNRQTECVFCEYEFENAGNSYLLLVKYPDNNQAKEALDSFNKHYVTEQTGEETARIGDEKLVKAECKKNYVIMLFDSPSQDWAEEITAEIYTNLE